MSPIPTANTTTTSSSSNFQAIFLAAFKAYKRQTGKDIITHPLATHIQSCNSPNDIISVLQEQAQQVDQSRARDERLTKWLYPTVNVLYALSATLSEGVGLVFSPAKVVFAGIGILLLAAKDVGASQDALIEIFERIENFFKRVEAYTQVPPTAAMTEVIVKIVVEVLSILALATKEVKQGRTKKYLKKLAGRTDIEDGLQSLDRLIQEEVRMATAEVFKVTHEVEEIVTGVDVRVKEVDDKVKIIIDDGKETRTAVQQMVNELEDQNRNELREKLRTWLSPADPSTNHNIARNAHHEGTAAWFFKGRIFNEWKSTGSLLWIHGKPGSGKSILCSAIIQDIMALQVAGTASMAYFYFDFRDLNKQNLRNLLPSLLIQLSARSTPRCDILSRLYLAHDFGAQKPSDVVLTESLKEMLSLSGQDPSYIIIDALDECPNTSRMPSPREEVLEFVNHLVGLDLPNLRICVTSRPEIDIRSTLEPLSPHPVSLHNEGGQKKDIVDYVSSVVHLDKRMRRWREEDKVLVIEKLSEKADGMFRWVFCQLEVLRHCFPPSVRSILEELPESLDETYERVLREINKANREHAHRLLQCLTVAVRPLHVEELAEVLAVDFNMGGIPKLNSDWRWQDQEEAVLSACSSLVGIVGEGGSRVVQFSHFSVKEFLTSKRLSSSSEDVSWYQIHLEDAHAIIAQACLGILLGLDDKIDKERMGEFPLGEYAAEHWVTHARFENVMSKVKDGVQCLFDEEKPHFAAWVWVHNVESFGSSTRGIHPVQPDATPLYYAACLGLHDLTEYLASKRPQDVNAKGGYYGSPLHAALSKDHVPVSFLLLDRGADVNMRGRWGQTPLHRASARKSFDVGQRLLDLGADVNAREVDNWTPLYMAANMGRLRAVQMLIRHGAEIDAPDNDGRTPLHRASEKGHLEVMRSLLENGANAHALDGKGRTALQVESNERSEETIALLSEYGAQ